MHEEEEMQHDISKLREQFSLSQRETQNELGLMNVKMDGL